MTSTTRSSTTRSSTGGDVRRPFLLFDLGGVLIENAGPERMQALLPHPSSPDEFKQRWLASDAVRAFERGRIESHAFAARLIDEWRLACEPDAFIDDFAHWVKGFYPGARTLLAVLRGQGPIGCLSNSNAIHWSRFDGFADCFDVTLSSHLTGLIKPDRACFVDAIARCGGDARQIRYYDDAAINVAAARDAGLQATHVDGFDALRRALIDDGFVTAPI